MNKLEKIQYNYGTSKQRWHEICESGVYMPIYHKDWYWDAVCDSPDDWKVIVYETKDVTAAFPFQYKKIHGMWRIENAWQVARGGIWIDFKKACSFNKKMSLYSEIAEYMLRCLPYYDLFNVNFLPEFDNCSVFCWNGYHTMVHYNYFIRNRTEKIVDSFSKRRKQRIHNAEKTFSIRVNALSNGEIWDFYKISYEGRKRDISYEREAFFRLLDALKKRDAVQVRAAYVGDQLAAIEIALVDDRTMYHQFLTHLVEYQNAQSLLTYDAIQFAMATNRKFDFEGSMIKGVAENIFTFSPETEICYAIHDESAKYRTLHGIKDILKRG